MSHTSTRSTSSPTSRWFPTRTRTSTTCAQNPRAATPAPQRRRRHRLGRGQRGLQGHRHVLQRASRSAARSRRCRSTPEGDDLGPQIEAHRSQIPMNEHMVTMDPPDHTRARSILSRLLTPSRLKENEDFMWQLADRQLDEFLGDGECEFIAEYAKPFSMLVIADLLGVPEEDHKEFRTVLGRRPSRRAGRGARPRVGRHQPAGVARRQVLLLHRRPPQLPP